tara:strand:+ start:1154 stop:1726 length:573 start_codon:yes stop_codon:yes gene_type:complete
MKNIKILKNIIIDKNELKNFYNSIKHKAKNYIETHPKNKKNPYLICVCKKCNKTYNGHKFIRRLERYKNYQITELIEKLNYITKTDKPNWPTIWIYPPHFLLPPHKDFARNNSIIIPITPTKQKVIIYNEKLPIVNEKLEHNENYIEEEYTYDEDHPNVLNTKDKIHGVLNGKEERIFLNFSGYCEWNDI